MRHSGWFPDRVLRLFRRDRARFTDDVVHERVVCDGVVARLNEPILHYPVARLEDAIRRIDQYSTLGAEKLAASDRKISALSGVTHGVGTFLRVYLLKLGFLDGAAGFMAGCGDRHIGVPRHRGHSGRQSRCRRGFHAAGARECWPKPRTDRV